MNKRSNVDNLDIIPFAVYKLGGVGVFVDVEDVFVCSYKLAPERFGWRKYQYPNYKILSKALRDFEGKYPNYLIKTPDGLSRQLSAEGLEWLKEWLPDFERALNVPGVNPPVRRPIQRMLNDIEAEELPPTEKGGTIPLLSLIPEQAYAYISEDRTLTVFGRREDIPEGAEIEVSVDPMGVLEILTPKVTLRPHVRRDDVMVGQVRLRPILADESTIVSVKYESASAAALVEVRATRIIPPIEELVPEALQFERPSYRVGWQRKKELLVLAPQKDIARFGTRLKLSTSDPGVPVLTPSIILRPHESGKFYIACVQVEARILHTKAVIIAQCKEAFASTHVIVMRQEESGGFKIQLLDEEWGNFRAIIETEVDEHGQQTRVINIAGRHPAIRTYLGKNFELQNTSQAQAILAEVVADVTSRFVVTELFRLRRSTEVFDADRIYREHYKRVTRFLPRLQRVLIRDTGEAPGLGRSLIEVRRDK